MIRSISANCLKTFVYNYKFSFGSTDHEWLISQHLWKNTGVCLTGTRNNKGYIYNRSRSRTKCIFKKVIQIFFHKVACWAIIVWRWCWYMMLMFVFFSSQRDFFLPVLFCWCYMITQTSWTDHDDFFDIGIKVNKLDLTFHRLIKFFPLSNPVLLFVYLSKVTKVHFLNEVIGNILRLSITYWQWFIS